MLCPQNELLFWQRFAVKPPLGVLNAMLAQPVALAFGFHPFGDGGQKSSSFCGQSITSMRIKRRVA